MANSHGNFSSSREHDRFDHRQMGIASDHLWKTLYITDYNKTNTTTTNNNVSYIFME
jgi:hypothetical protein